MAMAMEAQEVAVRLRLLDGAKFKAEAEEASASVKGLGTAVAEANAEADASGAGGLTGFLGGSGKALDTVSGKLDRFSHKALQVGRQTAVMSAGAGFLIYESVKEAASYEGKMTLLMTQAHATLQMKKELEAKGKGMSQFGIDPTEFADALYPTQSVFHNVKKDYESVKAAAEGAAIGHDTLANATNAMVAGFKTGFKDVHGFKEEMALLDETVGAGKMHLPELTAIFHGSLMPTGAALGMSQRSLLATIASVSQEGQEPEEFSTRLRTALLKTVNLKGEALAAASKMGFSKTRMQEDLRQPEGMLKLLRELAAASKRLGPNEGPADIAAVFGGSRSAGTILTALHNLKANEEITARLNGVGGSKTLDTHFAETTHTLTFQMKELKGETHEALLEMGKFFGPPVIGGLKDLAGFLKGAAHAFGELPGPVKDGAGILLVFAAAAAPVAFLVGGLSAGLRLLLVPLKLVFSGIGLLTDVSLPAMDTALLAGTGALASFAAIVAPGAAIYLGLEAINRLLGGQHSVINEVIKGYENWGHLIHDLFGQNLSEGGKVEKHMLHLDKHKKAYEDHRKATEHSLGHRPNIGPHQSWLHEWENREMEHEGASTSSKPSKIELHSHIKVDLNGRQLALELHKPLQEIERADNHRK
jgi:hypothetical protein